MEVHRTGRFLLLIYLKSRYDIILGKPGVRQYAKCIMMYGPRRCGKTRYLIDRVKEVSEEYSVCFVSFIDKIAKRIHKDNGFGKNVLSIGCRSFDKYTKGHVFDFVFWDDFDFVHNSFNRGRVFELIDTKISRQLRVSVSEKNDFNYKSWEFVEVPPWHRVPDYSGTQGVTGYQGYTGVQGVTGGYYGSQGITGLERA
jgi:hypothetical protein